MAGGTGRRGSNNGLPSLFCVFLLYFCVGEADNEGPPKRHTEVETLRVNMNLINIDHHCVGHVPASQTLTPETSMDDCVFHSISKTNAGPFSLHSHLELLYYTYRYLSRSDLALRKTQNKSMIVVCYGN